MENPKDGRSWASGNKPCIGPSYIPIFRTLLADSWNTVLSRPDARSITCWRKRSSSAVSSLGLPERGFTPERDLEYSDGRTHPKGCVGAQKLGKENPCPIQG